MSIEIKELKKEHWTAVSFIYQEGITTGNATFEQLCPGWEEWDKNHRKDCRFVVVFNNDIIGWAALSDVSSRCIYSGVCEVSVYVSEKARGKGVGQLLLSTLIQETEKNGIWTLQVGVFPENESSIRLFEKSGFREVGIREKIGKMNEKWRDVILLERRSTITGVD